MNGPGRPVANRSNDRRPETEPDHIKSAPTTCRRCVVQAPSPWPPLSPNRASRSAKQLSQPARLSSCWTSWVVVPFLDDNVLPVCRIVCHKRFGHPTNCANFVEYLWFWELVESVRHVADEIGMVVEQGSDPVLNRSLSKSVNQRQGSCDCGRAEIAREFK